MLKLSKVLIIQNTPIIHSQWYNYHFIKNSNVTRCKIQNLTEVKVLSAKCTYTAEQYLLVMNY